MGILQWKKYKRYFSLPYFWSLKRIIKMLFFIALFTDEKRGKSHQRERSSLFENSPPCLGDANQRTSCIG